MTEIEAINTSVVTYQSVVGCRFGSSYSPNLDCLIERCRTKHVWILGVDLNLHDIVLVIHKRVNFGPIFLPIEHSNCIVV